MPVASTEFAKRWSAPKRVVSNRTILSRFSWKPFRGSAAQFGSTLVDMEQHVNGLQKNLDALKKVKAALGG